VKFQLEDAAAMAPRMMVVCLGGLAGAGALVCCDMDEDPETLDVAEDGAPEESIEAATDPEAEAQTVPIH
jgi:hypothetical protein